ncbi:MAG TPA: M13 family metallopeptidase [Aliidongia sp.]|nr:M13 family metallopeptidase [Aliidongia sp.]
MRLTMAAAAVAAALSMAALPSHAAETSLKVLDPSLLDRSASPCQDLYQFACGGWLKANPVPPDQPYFGRANELALRNREMLRGLLDDAAAHPTPDNQKVADFYGACTDEAAIEAKGLAPLQQELDRIAALSDKKDLPALAAHLQEIGVNVLFNFGEEPDFKDARRSIAVIEQGGLGLPDRDYYFKTDAKSVSQREAYEAHVARMLALLGDAPERSAAEAKAILALETVLAKRALDHVQRRDPKAVYHKQPVAELARAAPDFGWSGFFTGSGAPGFDSLNVSEPAFFKGMSDAVRSAPLDTLKAYLRWQLVHAAAPMLPKAFVDENFAFYGQTLRGAKELEPRWRRCVIVTDAALGEALGKLYVAKAFSPDAKARMKEMVQALRAAYAADLESLPWMGKETKAKALAKLDAMVDKIGYPDKWRDYSALTVARDDALGNGFRATAFENRREYAKIGKPVDRNEWHMTPPTVNAYYDDQTNDINFPAGFLQPPFFDLAEDDAANYGSVGATIGHEMTHGFDDQGRQFDKDGNLADWWTKADAKKFEARAACLADQASHYTVVDDVKMNGKLTLGENTADNGGLYIAYAAYKNATKGAAPTEIDGFTPDQRFFIAYAQGWCTGETPEIARLHALNDPHPDDKFRANGVVSNMEEFGQAFKCPIGSPMIRKSACRVW